MKTIRLRVAFVTAAIPLLLHAYLQTRQSEISRPFDSAFYAEVPLSDRPKTWGTADPTWSPKGDEIAFSLFGSLWRVAASGGDAAQVTAASGSYDAAPAWSPDGRVLAFIRGSRPIGGIQIGAAGRLMLHDLTTGEDRPLGGERQFTGSPVWAPDGASIVANELAGTEPILQQINVRDGTMRRLTGAVISRRPTIVQRGNGWWYYWFPAAIDRGGRWLAYGGDRDGTPQLWRVPFRDGLTVTSKLTSYSELDQADIQDVAWLNSDTLLYSANLNNSRTNYDLWRQQGAASTRLTWTLQDEYSPRVSPDGTRVLFVSNYLGNLDLYTTTPEAKAARRLGIEGLRFKNGSATLRLRLEGAARVSVRAADGKYYTPRGALYRYNAGMGDSAGFFHARGDVELTVPAGTVRIAAFRGFEHEPFSTTIEAPGETSISFARRLRWQENGWHSGEDHVHANYAGPYYLRPEDALLMAEAEDVNVTNMLVANAEGERPYDREFFEGRVSRFSSPKHLLYWNEEFRNRIIYGHMALLNLRTLTNPIYTSFEGTPNPYDYPTNTMVARQARQQNAVVDYVHPVLGNTRDPFDFTVSAKELPVTAALGLVDVLDIYPWGPTSLDLYYQLLNCGLRIAPGAGTDTFSNWRSINQLPGNSRVYVESTGPLSYAAWVEGLRSGRSFVTNGPLLSLKVNGAKPGATLKAAHALRVTVEASAEALTPLNEIELVRNGEVVYRAKGPVRWTADVNESGWLAARVTGAASPRALGAPAQAHTAPVYLEVGGPMKPKPEAAALFLAWIDRLADLVAVRNNFATPAHRAEVTRQIAEARALFAKWAGNYATRPTP